MKRFTNLAAGLFLAAALCVTPALAEPQKFVLDPAHADITFRIMHLGYSFTHGRFDEMDGDIMLDLDDLPKSSVSITIPTNSINTRWEKRDTHLRSADFFNVEAHPEMTFKSTAIEAVDKDNFKAAGDLTLLGQTHPVTLDVKVNKIEPHPRSKLMTVGATMTGTLKRSQWGMGFGTPNIGDDVEIRLDVEASAEK